VRYDRFGLHPEDCGLTETLTLCRYLVESIRKFPDAVTFAEEIQDAGLRFVDYEAISGGIVAIHWGFKV
jgi:ubiquinone/menaquinone biosynthesis C-methylase UbiE